MTEGGPKRGGRALSLELRTPHRTVFDEPALSLRLPTETGHVGLRAGAEATVLAIEAGIVIARTAGGARYFGSPGGLLRFDGRRAVLLTPFCVGGDTPDEVASRLSEALEEPDAEMEARKALETLEERIIRDLRSGDAERGATQRRARRP